MKIIKYLITILFLFCTTLVFSANVIVPSLELYSRAALQDDRSIHLQTEAEMDLLIAGGYKFGGRVVFGFISDSLEQNFINGIIQGNFTGSGLGFKSASITIRDLFSLPLNFIFFIGESDVFAFGEDYGDIFGTTPIQTNYSGFLYFSDIPQGRRYEGVHRPAGTGIQLLIKPIINNKMSMSLLVYQDGYFYRGSSTSPTFSPGHYSVDYRIMCNFNKVKFEYFLGGTWPASDYGYYRTGFLFWGGGKIGAVLIQAGMTRWSPSDYNFELGWFFILVEPRISVGFFSFIPTVLIRPAYYNQQATVESGLIDFNIKLHFGKVEHMFNGGIETNLAFQEEYMQDLQTKVSAYFSFAIQGVLWIIKVNAKVYPFELQDMFEGFIGIKAEF
jgi:hypothetical protein